MNVRFLAPARTEFRRAVEYYEAQRPGLGAAFREEVYSAVERIEKMPDAWRPLSKNTRRHRIQKFPYGVIYAVVQGEIVIVAIAHAHREPEYWQSRLSRRP